MVLVANCVKLKPLFLVGVLISCYLLHMFLSCSYICFFHVLGHFLYLVIHIDLYQHFAPNNLQTKLVLNYKWRIEIMQNKRVLLLRTC